MMVFMVHLTAYFMIIMYPNLVFLLKLEFIYFKLIKKYVVCFFPRMNQMKNIHHQFGVQHVMVLIVLIHLLKFQN